MEINKKDLKKISRKFRMMASRVLNAHHTEINSTIKMFIDYVDRTNVISEYIENITEEDIVIENILKQVVASYGRLTVPLGNTPEQEIGRGYQVLKYIHDNQSFQTHSLGMAYTSSSKIQDMIENFGRYIVSPFANGINEYLYDITIDMGYDEERNYMINVSGGQAQLNISNDNSSINATQKVQINQSKIDEAIADLKKNLNSDALNANTKDIILDQLEVIEVEKNSKHPKKEVFNKTLKTINSILSSIPLADKAIESAKKLYEIVNSSIQ